MCVCDSSCTVYAVDMNDTLNNEGEKCVDFEIEYRFWTLLTLVSKPPRNDLTRPSNYIAIYYKTPTGFVLASTTSLINL